MINIARADFQSISRNVSMSSQKNNWITHEKAARHSSRTLRKILHHESRVTTHGTVSTEGNTR